MIRKYAEIFCWKNVSSFCIAKATHIFSAKNIRILYIESARTVNEMTLNKLVKLTTLWTTRPSYLGNQKIAVIGCCWVEVPLCIIIPTTYIRWRNNMYILVKKKGMYPKVTLEFPSYPETWMTDLTITVVKMPFWTKKYWYRLYVFTKSYVVGTH